MNRIFADLFRMALFIVPFLLLNSCFLAKERKIEQAPPVFIEKYSELPAKEIKKEILRLQKIAKTHKDPQIRSEAHYHLARLFIAHQNPAPNYSQSVKEFNRYIKEKGDPEKSHTAKDWVKTIQRSNHYLQRIRNYKNKVKDLNYKNSNLKKLLAARDEEIKKLKAQITRLNQNIKKLDALYFKIEKKKKETGKKKK